MLPKHRLKELYCDRFQSSANIARVFKCSEHQVNYWLKKYKITKRSIAEAIYLKHNPNGDPFCVNKPRNIKDAFLYGLGLGLYWGEGTKRNKSAIRLGNTDPKLIRKFMDFLIKIYGIKRTKLRFGLQIFSDMNPKKALNYWRHELRIPASQFQKVIVTPSRGIGTYKEKTKHGVLTINFHNKKLRDILCSAIESI